MAENDTMRAVRVNLNSKVAARQLNNELKLAIRLRKVELQIQEIILCRFTTANDLFHIVTLFSLVQSVGLNQHYLIFGHLGAAETSRKPKNDI